MREDCAQTHVGLAMCVRLRCRRTRRNGVGTRLARHESWQRTERELERFRVKLMHFLRPRRAIPFLVHAASADATSDGV